MAAEDIKRGKVCVKGAEMKPKAKIKLSVDIMMTVLPLFMMGYQLWGEAAHEWAGAGMMLLFVIHHVLNAGWHKNLFRGRYTRSRIMMAAIDILLFAAMLCLMGSGIVMSRHVFAFLPFGRGMGTARLVHMAACYWGFALMSLHLGLHWGMVLTGIRNCTGIREHSGIRTLCMRVLGAGAAAYGLSVFLRRNLLTYMFLQTQFVFLDFSESPVSFYVDYLALMGLFVWCAYYMSRIRSM